jgi:hypothetical protein
MAQLYQISAYGSSQVKRDEPIKVLWNLEHLTRTKSSRWSEPKNNEELAMNRNFWPTSVSGSSFPRASWSGLPLFRFERQKAEENDE